MRPADRHLTQMLRADWDAAWRPSPGYEDGIDWTGVARRAIEQGVAALFYRSLSRTLPGAPDEVLDAAHRHLERAQARGAALVAQTLDVVHVLHRAGISAIPFKGVVLGLTAHASAAMRESRDIDVLVPAEAMAGAVRALAQLGYAPTEVFPPRIMQACYRSYGQDILFANGRVPVEPHGAFGPHALAADIDVEGMRRRAIAFELGGERATVLSAEDMLLVACFHGSKEKWSRLLWVADIAAFVHRHPHLDWQALLDRASAYGTRRMVVLGLALAREVFVTPLPAMIVAAIDGDDAIRRLVDASSAHLFAGNAGVGSVHHVSRYHLRARERYADRVRYVFRTVTTPQFAHYRMVKLPDPLVAAYVPVKLVHDYLLQPLARSAVRLGLRRARRSLAAPRSVTSRRPPSGAHLFYLEDEGILFSEARQELHHVNTSAAIVWSLLEEGATEAEAARELAALCALDGATSARYVSAAIEQWREARLLDAPSPPAATPGAAPVVAQPGELPASPADFAPAIEHHYRLMGTTFHVRYSAASEARMVDPVLAHLAAGSAGERVVTVEIVSRDARIRVYRDGALAGECRELRELAPIVKSLVWQSAINGYDYFLDIHAGVVGDDRGCLLLPGPSGSGKSTLTAALVHAGFLYYSDEIALLARDTLDVVPAPLALCVKSAGRAAVESLFPFVRDLPSHRRMDGKEVTYFPPPAARRAAGDHSRPVEGIVFPRYRRDAAPAMAPLAKAAALKRLLDECLVVPKRLEVSDVTALVRWVARIPCYTLVYSLTADAVASVAEVFPSRILTR